MCFSLQYIVLFIIRTDVFPSWKDFSFLFLESCLKLIYNDILQSKLLLCLPCGNLQFSLLKKEMSWVILISKTDSFVVGTYQMLFTF